MASEHYHMLYSRATEREHVLVGEVQKLWYALEMDDLQACSRLAMSLQEAHENFLDGLEPVARKMGVNLRQKGCPNCGDPNCQGDAPRGPMFVSSKGILQDLLQQLLGGKPKPPEPEQE